MLWAFTNTEVFYFSHQDKIYRYNPLNEEIKALEVDFRQKNITLLKKYRYIDCRYRRLSLFFGYRYRKIGSGLFLG